MIFTILQWLWLILLLVGLPLLLLRPLRLKLAANKPVTERTKSWLWFLQAVGFWALVIGGWMKLEALIPQLLEEDEEELAEIEEEDGRADGEKEDGEQADDDDAEGEEQDEG